MLRCVAEAEELTGRRAWREPRCQVVVQDGVNASASRGKHPAAGDVRGYATSLPPPDHSRVGDWGSPSRGCRYPWPLLPEMGANFPPCLGKGEGLTGDCKSSRTAASLPNEKQREHLLSIQIDQQ